MTEHGDAPIIMGMEAKHDHPSDGPEPLVGVQYKLSASVIARLDAYVAAEKLKDRRKAKKPITTRRSVVEAALDQFLTRHKA